MLEPCENYNRGVRVLRKILYGLLHDYTTTSIYYTVVN